MPIRTNGDFARNPQPTGFLARSPGLIGSVIFVCLLAVLVITPIPYGTTEAWWESLFECAVFALTAVWLIEVLLRGNWEIKKLWLLLPLAIITIYAFAQMVQWPAGLPIVGGRLTAQRTLTIDRYQTYLTARKTL